MASQLARIARAVGALFTRAPSEPVTTAGAGGGLANVRGSPRLSFGFSYQPHEPFAGAWQKNIAAANPRDPNLLAYSGVYACVTVISQDIAKMPARLMRLLADGVTEEVHRNSPYHKLLRKPNSYQTSLAFFQFLMVSRLLRGNAYIFQEFDARGVASAWHLMHPDRTFPMVDPVTKNIYYEYTPHQTDMFIVDGYRTELGTIRIPARFVIHDRINCLWHPLVGTSPMFAAAVTAMTGGRILMNTERLFANMSRPSGVLSAPGNIEDNTADRLKREFEANFSEGNMGRTAVLGDGLTWEGMVMTSTDAQLIDQLKWTIEDVARCFRVPMYLLADVTRMTYKNSEQAAQSYFSGCLQYHVEDIEARLTAEFGLDEMVEYVAFDVNSMFRMDTMERYSAYRAGIAAGVLAPNEARKKEGLGPVKGGDEPRMQMQYVPLSTPVADPTAPAPSAPAPAPAPADDKPPADDDSSKGLTLNVDPEEDDDEPDEADHTAALEMLAIMRRVSAGAARARFAFEDRKYDNGQSD